MESFKKLGLSQELIKTLAEAGFKEPTEIQEKTIPLALAGKDIIGGSATGSGKTLAFGSSIIEKIKRREGVMALVITPTRELAEQVGKALKAFSKYKPLNLAIVYGGVGLGPQVHELSKADVVVGTPGRILDHLERRTFNLKKIQTLVLDEADRMLDMGFIEDVDKIICQCPKERQTFLFSATISSDINHIAKKYMKNPQEVSVDSYVDPSQLKQSYYDVPQEMKFSLLAHLLKEEHPGLIMIFTNTRRMADVIALNLSRTGIDAMAIHGGLTQQKRNKIMEHFHSGRVVVLICTDVAARGLDIKGVSHVYNYDIPANDKDYVHRIGRTARAGKDGKAVSLVSSRDYMNFRSVLRNPDLHIEQINLPENVANVGFQMRDSSSRGRFQGRGRFGNRERSFGGERGRGFNAGRSHGRERGGFGGRREGRNSFSSRRSFGGRGQRDGLGYSRNRSSERR